MGPQADGVPSDLMSVMTKPMLQALSDQSAESLVGGVCWSLFAPMPSHPQAPSLPILPCLPAVAIPEICVPKISLDWGQCKPKAC
jgi:hypothetical protein